MSLSLRPTPWVRLACSLALAGACLPAVAAPSYSASLLPVPPEETLADGSVARAGFGAGSMFSPAGPLASLDGHISAGTIYNPSARSTLVSSEPWKSGSPGDQLLTYKVPHTDAFLRIGGQIERFGLAGMDTNTAVGFNAKGQVLGQAENIREVAILQGGFGIPMSSSQTVTQRQAFLYEKGVVTPLTLGGKDSSAVAINANGVVLGTSTLQGENGWGSFLYSNGQTQAIGPAGSAGVALNDRGDVIGTTFLPDLGRQAFLYSQGHVTDLAVAGHNTEAVAIAANGDVVLNARGIDGALDGTTPYLYKDGRITAIEVRDITGRGVVATFAHGLNGLGMVTGTQLTGSYTAGGFLYANGEFLNLDSLVDPALGLHFVAGEHVDESGRVVAVTPSGDRYLLNPLQAVPEPTTMGLMLMGLAAVGVAARRRGQH